MYMNKKGLYIVIIVLLVALGSITAFGYSIWSNEINKDLIYDGVYIDGISVGNKTKEAALEILKENKESNLQESIRLYTQSDSYTMKLSDIDYKFDYDKAIDEAYKLGKDGNPIERYFEIRDLKKQTKDIPLELNYNKEKIAQISNEVAANLGKESQNAKFNYNGGNFTIDKEQTGITVNAEKLKTDIEENLGTKSELEIPVEIIEPKYNQDHYRRINGVIGKYTTEFKNSGIGRKKNIAISGGSVNGLMIEPGETVSYNMITGPRQRKFGYEEAPIILNGEYIPGVGGGVCQTSTTLYNTLLLADLTIVKRSHHSIPPAYVLKGTDAVVTDGALDLVFRNDFDFPVYFSTYVTDKSITITAYGDVNVKDYTVSIKPDIVETIPFETEEVLDPELDEGKTEITSNGRNGYRVNTYKSKVKNNNVIETKLITQDYYKPAKRVVKKGTKKIATPDIQTEETPNNIVE